MSASGRGADFLVIGAGVMGLAVALELKRRYGDSRITILEKENKIGAHASGRNSGVLHAGFYYSPDSLKARYTKEGNAALRAYCAERGIALNACGKLVVARDEGEHAALDELIRRGRANGIALEEVDERGAREIEPRALTAGRALYSPTTASLDPLAVVAALSADAERAGIDFELGAPVTGRSPGGVATTRGERTAGYVVNAAGLYADRLARMFGFSEHYRILPFKGLYLISDEPPGAYRTNLYPVPDLRNPFLGVHVTVTVDGRAKLGPTAIPAFWREQYSGAANFKLGELLEILWRQLRLFGSAGFDFRRLAFEELQKYRRVRMVALAQHLARGIERRHFNRWSKPGIRAQLLDLRTQKLEMDFVLEGDERSMHVLNAVSPAFTCAFPFARRVADEIARRIEGRAVREAAA